MPRRRPNADQVAVSTAARRSWRRSTRCGALTRVLDAPLALHPQVGVQRGAGVEAVQEVLAAGDDLEGA